MVVLVIINSTTQIYSCMHWSDEKLCKILIGKSEGKRSRGRPKHRWKDNIIMDLRETELETVDWIHLAQDRNQWWNLLYMVMNLRVP
jgi:hypothetical protein